MDFLLLPIPPVVRDLHWRTLEAAPKAVVEVEGEAGMKARVAFLGALLCLAARPVGAGDDRMSMRVSPAVAFAPANLVVRATIPASADNRVVEIVAESADFFRSSEMQLDGDRAPRTSLFEFRSLPPGLYEVRATLRGSRGEERGMARQQVNVIAAGAR